MVTRANGPTVADYGRALKAAKKAGAKAMRIEIGDTAFVFALTDEAISKLTSAAPAEPAAPPRPKLHW